MPLFDSISSLARTHKPTLVEANYNSEIAIRSGQIQANFLHLLVKKAVDGFKRATSPKGSQSQGGGGGGLFGGGGLLGGLINKVKSGVRSISQKIGSQGGLGGILKSVGGKIRDGVRSLSDKFRNSPVGGLLGKIGSKIGSVGAGGLGGILGSIGGKLGSIGRSVTDKLGSLGNSVTGALNGRLGRFGQGSAKPTGADDGIFSRILNKARTAGGSLSDRIQTLGLGAGGAACPSCPPCSDPSDPMAILRRERDEALSAVNKASKSAEHYTSKCVKKILAASSKTATRIALLTKKLTASPFAEDACSVNKKVLSALDKTFAAVKHTMPHGEVRQQFASVVSSLQAYSKVLCASAQQCRSQQAASIMAQLRQAMSRSPVMNGRGGSASPQRCACGRTTSAPRLGGRRGADDGSAQDHKELSQMLGGDSRYGHQVRRSQNGRSQQTRRSQHSSSQQTRRSQRGSQQTRSSQQRRQSQQRGQSQHRRQQSSHGVNNKNERTNKLEKADETDEEYFEKLFNGKDEEESNERTNKLERANKNERTNKLEKDDDEDQSEEHHRGRSTGGHSKKGGKSKSKSKGKGKSKSKSHGKGKSKGRRLSEKPSNKLTPADDNDEKPSNKRTPEEHGESSSQYVRRQPNTTAHGESAHQITNSHPTKASGGSGLSAHSITNDQDDEDDDDNHALADLGL